MMGNMLFVNAQYHGFVKKQTLIIFDLTTGETYVLCKAVVILFCNVSPLFVASFEAEF